MRFAGVILACLPLACSPSRPSKGNRAATSASTAAPSTSASQPANEPPPFRKKRVAKPGEWLHEHPEKPQSFDSYTRSEPIRPTATRNVIVMQPLGALGAKQTALIGKMREVMAAFFALPVEVRPAIALPDKGRRVRTEGGRVFTQHHTRVLLDEVLASRVPNNAVVYVGVIAEDLYPEPEWNYVFGEATLEKRVGVYSLARLFPEFWGEKSSPATDLRAFVKGSQILVHETGHAFSLPHCTEYECVMNGMNSLEELDDQFGELCPVCLRKLAWNVGFDTAARYRTLRDLYRREGAEELAAWFDARLVEAAPR